MGEIILSVCPWKGALCWEERLGVHPREVPYKDMLWALIANIRLGWKNLKLYLFGIFRM
jgi:hypothetical protein